MPGAWSSAGECVKLLSFPIPSPPTPPHPHFLEVCPQSWIRHLGEIEEGREKYSRDSLSILPISLGVEAQMEGMGMLLQELRRALWSPLQASISMRKAHVEWTEVS